MNHFLFWTKKFLTFAIYPLPVFFLLLFLASWYLFQNWRQGRGRLFLVLAWGWLLLWSYPYLPTDLLASLESRYPKLGSREQILAQYPDVDETIRYIVVLGGGANEDGDPNISVLTKLPDSALKRVLEGVRLHTYFPQAKIIMSGGEVVGVEEAEIMRQAAISLGVTAEAILKENRSLDTEDESRFIKTMVNGDRFFLVTSAWHMPRSVGLFQKQGLHLIAAPADFITDQSGKKSGFSLVIFPSPHCLLDSEIAIKEYLGMLVEKIIGRI